MTDAYKCLDRKPEIKRACGRLVHRWKDNVKVYFTELLGKVLTGFVLAEDTEP
jgi:hypothetical protein